MLTRETAKSLVTEYINTRRTEYIDIYNVRHTVHNMYECDPANPLVVLDEHTIAKEYGWVFFYTSRRFLETGDMNEAIGGNAPIIVDKETGQLHVTGTAYDIDYYLKRFEAQRRNPLRRLKQWMQTKNH